MIKEELKSKKETLLNRTRKVAKDGLTNSTSKIVKNSFGKQDMLQKAEDIAKREVRDVGTDFIRERLAKNFNIGKIQAKIPIRQISKGVQAGERIAKKGSPNLRKDTTPVLETMLIKVAAGILKEKKLMEQKEQKKEETNTWMGKISDDFISYTNLRMFPYEVVEIVNISIKHRINKHAELTISAVIEDSRKDTYVHQTGEISPTGVFYIAEDKPVVLFYGVVTDIRTTCEGNVHLLHIKASDMSYIMDIEKKSRSFQNIEMTSHQLIKKVMEDYTDSAVSIPIKEEPIGKLVIQYKETDWEFLCRFLSRYHQGIMTKMDQNQISFSAGVSEHEGQLKGKMKNYKICKNLKEYLSKKALNVPGITENDFVGYELTRPEILRLGEYITWDGQKFYVQKADYGMIEQVVKGKYLLRQINGLKREQYYNERIIGVSIQGKIKEVSRDRVKVKMEIDEKELTDYWFPYATVAASKDGGGWYCMPEVGEEVRVYCPLKEESVAYAASAISGFDPESSGGDSGNNRMSDPKNKSLKTAQGQEVKFTPAGVLIESNGGESKINLNMDGSVTVSGQKAIYFTCVENLSFRAEEEMQIAVQDKIDFMCEAEGTMIMSGDVTVAAKNIKNNC